MEFGARDIFHMKNDHAWGCRHLFSMASMFKPGHFDLAQMQEFRTQGLTLFMTVPCVYSPLEVFDKMVATAKGFCRMLGGKLLDHDRRPLTDQGLAHIRTQIQQIAADMRAKGVVPGSLTAIRLFSDE
jgi:cell division protein ZipA